ncbi:MAG: EamA family transporter RarD [Actinomycetota bacterium]|nr:EamA family transporter RarD [Actinomycetota bacterium]
MSEQRRGFLLGVAAYLLWGLFPLYWPLLEPATPLEILAHRIAWTLVVVVALLALGGRMGRLRAVLADPARRWTLASAAVLIAANWFAYIWGVNNERVVETALGYFITPLVTVLLGVLVLHERLRPLQWAALGMASVAVVWLTVEYGRLPWVAMVLAGSFAAYGLAKKQAGVGAVEGLTVETVVLAPAALLYLATLQGSGEAAFGQYGAGHVLLLVGTGVVTAVPLLCFGAAATRVPLTTIGLLQYIAPMAQFLLGVFVLHEDMTAARWGGFVLVWLALAIFTSEALARHRRQLRLAADAAAV